MRIGILGAGSIGGTLTRRLSQAGHQVRVANSRGPSTIAPALLEFGAEPVDAAVIAADVDVLISSIPFHSMSSVAPLLARSSPDLVVIDTSNYYPHRDGNVAALDESLAESAWVSEVLGRPIAKAWNAIGSQSFAAKACPSGASGRIAVPVAADGDQDRAVAEQLVDESGFDPFYTGPIVDSWRQQPASPLYCTDLTSDQMPAALASADQQAIPRRRDLTTAVIHERTRGMKVIDEGFGDWLVQLNRAIYL